MNKTDKVLNFLLQYLLEGYIFVISVVIPLYMGRRKYAQIAYDKFQVFKKAAWCLVIAFAVIQIIRLILNRRSFRLRIPRLSLTDVFALVYGVTLVVSYICASNRQEALYGAVSWYSGFFTQAVLLIIYWIYSRYFRWHKRVLLYLYAGSAAVILLGILNRFYLCLIDPENYVSTFISTIGNINWLAAYLSVTVPIGIGAYISGILPQICRIPVLLWILAAVTSVFTNGSNSLYPAFLVCLALMLLFGLENKDRMKKVLDCVLMIGISLSLLSLAQMIMEPTAFNKIIGDEFNIVYLFTRIHAGGVIILLSCLGLVLLGKKEIPSRISKLSDRILTVLITAGLIVIIGFPLIQITGWISIPDSLGHNRGLLWRLSRYVFDELPLYRKLIGIGPDNYGNYTMNDWNFMKQLLEVYPGMRVTSAHSEPLTMLINLGICGVTGYLGMIFTSVYRLLAASGETQRTLRIPVILALAVYHVDMLFSFHLFIALPFVFLLLAFAEQLMRESR